MTVKIDFGSGFIDVSDYVKYDTISINRQGYNSNYKASQSVCRFSLIYDASIYAMWFSSGELAIELYDGATLSFRGIVDKTRSREYDGVIGSVFIDIEANDYLTVLDVPVGDIVYADCKVLDPINPTNSIVHKLVAITGNTINVSSTVTIDTVIQRFSPGNDTQTVRNVLDTLLYEYGYSLHLDKGYILLPIKWAVDSAVTAHTFNDSNCIGKVSTKNTLDKYDAVTVTYNILAQANNVRLYTDNNCTFDSNGEFAGYSVPNGFDYPPEANVIDETTGVKQVVYQDYSDDGIKYRTNKAIVNNLDYNYKNFESDFTAIITTEGHFTDRSLESGLTVVTEEFGAKRCRLLYRNSSGSAKKVLYNNVYGTVWYRSADCTTTVGDKDSDKLDKYKTQYVYNKAVAENLAKALYAQYTAGNTIYSLTYDGYIPEGTLVTVFLGDGTNIMCQIMSSVYNGKTELYDYKCISCSANRPLISSQTYSYSGAVTQAPPFTIQATNKTINVPYVDGAPVYTNAYTTITVSQEGINVTSGWTLTATPTGVTGHFEGNSYFIDTAPAVGGSVLITASKTGFNSIATIIQVQGSDGGSTWQPLAPLVDVVAIKDGLEVTLTDKYLSGIQGINSYTATWYYNDVEQATMAFGDLDTIILPFASGSYYEATDIDTMSVKVIVTNTSGYDATTWVNKGAIDTDSYGTWLGYEPEVVPRINGRQLTLTLYAPPQAQGRERYGTIRYKIYIQKPVTGYNDTIWFKPAVNENPYTSEDNWKAVDQGLGYQSVRDTFQQVVPLDGQSTDSPQDTTYKYKVVMFNEAGEGTAVLQTIIALGTSIKDIVNAAITTNKLADGAVVNEKVAVGTLTADKLYVAMLSAISANLGTITGGMLKSTNNDYNLWAWSTMEVEGTTYYEGTMRVGGENQYLRVTPVIDDITGLIVDYDIVFKVGTFTAEADLTSFDGVFYVTDNNNPLFRTRIEENGIFMQKKTGTVWADVGLVKIDRFNNMTITNDADNLPDIGVIDSTAIIYHFNSGVLDTAGTNLGNITTDGTIKNLPSIVENTNYFEGKLSRTLTQTKQLVWNKSTLFNLAGNSIQMSNGLPEPISADYNSKASTAWGLTSAQVSAKLFKARV